MIRKVNFEWISGEQDMAKATLEKVAKAIIEEVGFNDPMRGENATLLVLRHELAIREVLNKIPFCEKALIAALKPESATPMVNEAGFNIICEMAMCVLKKEITSILGRSLQIQY